MTTKQAIKDRLKELDDQELARYLKQVKPGGLMWDFATDELLRRSRRPRLEKINPEDRIFDLLQRAGLAPPVASHTIEFSDDIIQWTPVRTEQLEALNEISSQLSHEIEDVNRLLDLITRSAIDILRVEAGSLLLIDEEEQDIVFRVVLGQNAQELLGKRIALDTQSLSAETIKREEPIIVNDTARDSRWHGEVIFADEDELEDDEEEFHSRAILTVPLMAQGVPIGVLQMINKKDRSNFTDEDAQLLTTFAVPAAVAIQNARLFASQDEQLLQRVGELDRMAAIDQSLKPGLSRELHYNGRMLILNFTDNDKMSREVVDAFFDAYIKYGDDLLPSKERFVVYDFHNSFAAATPYLGQRLAELSEIRPGEKGRVAMAISNFAIRNILRFFVRRRQHTQPDLEFGFFETREEAVEWVEIYLKQRLAEGLGQNQEKQDEKKQAET